MTVQETKLNRRDFLHYSSRAAVLLPLVGLSLVESSACSRANSASVENSATSPWKITVGPENEPGERLIISGRIYTPDGRTPTPGITLFIYQTDATGHYSPSEAGNNRTTRLRGVMQTNGDGRYEFSTIKPAPYPNRTNPAHIHAYVSGPGYPEYWIEDFLFDGDPYITPEMKQKFSDRGSQSSILKLTRETDGTWRGVRDIVIERCSKNCTSR